MIPKPFFQLIDLLLGTYSFIVLVGVVLSWLIGFGVINKHNQIVGWLWSFTNSLTEPALRRIRRFVPDLGSVDISPAILLIGLWFLRQMNVWIALKVSF
ncbi:MAG: YggT family protein [Parvularculaceae bacterium]